MNTGTLLLKGHVGGFWFLVSSLVLPECRMTQQNQGAIGLKFKQHLSILMPTLVLSRAWMWRSAFLGGKLSVRLPRASTGITW